MKRKVYLFLLITIWIVLIGSLIYTAYFDGNSSYVSLETGLKNLPDESEWMNIFHEGRKMGHSVSTIENQAKDGYRIKSSTHLNVVFGGLESEVHLETSARMDTLFRLNHFSFIMLSDQYSTHIIGDKSGTKMTLRFIQGKDTSVSVIDVPEDLYTYTAIQPMVASKGIVKGQTIRVPAYDPMSNEMADVFISHEGKEVQEISSNKMILNKLRIDFKGIPSIMWLDDNGLTYKEETIMGMTMERTTPEEAMARPQTPEVDLLSGFAVKPNTWIRNPEKLKKLVLEIDGIKAESIETLSNERQTIISTLPLKLQLSKKATRVDPAEVNKHLKSTEMIQSQHPSILGQLERILSKKDNQEHPSEALTAWVFGYLEKRPVASISGAVDILNTGVGDCTEHTTLYTALSRAGGIPTKIHIGLVYLQGKFLFHAWPVVAINGEWVDVDPSLNQFPADVTHIALLEGDFENLTDLIPVLGNIKIKVLEEQF
ncbi:MAG: transglutaminase-like domain-containing protein [Candidatus Marinimicrobia bacterium]|nr:transglutaminase-like domain-containing protein [Candidatus Neomarinimicrobiota bacterium]